MFAVFRTGGKQYRVSEKARLEVEKLPFEVGTELEFPDVLMVGDESGTKVGSPIVKGAAVAAKIVEQIKGDKIIVFKKKRRQNYRRKRGHRQLLTVLEVTKIKAG
jgi:large subunit ribosomal protein L21